MMRRVVVTGMGIVSSLGASIPAAFARLKDLRNAVERSADLAGYKGLQTCLWAPAHWVRPSVYSRKIVRTMSPVSEMALFATEQALAQAGLLVRGAAGRSVIAPYHAGCGGALGAGGGGALGDRPLPCGVPGAGCLVRGGRCGVAYGSCSGGVAANADFLSVLKDREVRNVTSSTYIKMMPQTCAVNLSVHFGTTGRLLPTGTACTSGSLAIGEAFEQIRYGKQDVMIAGGAEEFSATQVAVFDTLFATSRRNDAPATTPRAFDVARDGLVIGDGAATLILEEREQALARGAQPLAEIVGFGTNTDGRHVTQPHADTMAVALRLALEDAGLAPSAIGYVNAHGTATELGDIAEGTATHAVFGAHHPAVSTIKNYTGHTLGACGAIEAALTIEMLRHNWFAPNLNLAHPDPRCGDNDFIMGEGRALETEFALTNNFAFGGVNTSLVLRRI